MSKAILIVENLDTLRDVLKDELNDDGHTVITASSIAQARELIKDKEIGLAILDLKLPGESGLDYSKELKVSSPGVPVIFCTGYWNDEDLMQIDSSQVVDIFYKPFDMDELRKRVKEILK